MNDTTITPGLDWLAKPQPEFPGLAHLVGVVALELEALPARILPYLTPAEAARLDSMTPRRGLGFLGVRLGCKYLLRSLIPDGMEIPDWNAIQTIRNADGRPYFPLPCDDEPYSCSASHDSRFAFVAVSTRPVGIDVEYADNRALKGAGRFLDHDEHRLIPADNEKAPLCATRLWTIKEAACKALGMGLIDGWRDVKILRTTDTKSTASTPAGMLEASHCLVGGHVFTIVAEP